MSILPNFYQLTDRTQSARGRPCYPGLAVRARPASKDARPPNSAGAPGDSGTYLMSCWQRPPLHGSPAQQSAAEVHACPNSAQSLPVFGEHTPDVEPTWI